MDLPVREARLCVHLEDNCRSLKAFFGTAVKPQMDILLLTERGLLSISIRPIASS